MASRTSGRALLGALAVALFVVAGLVVYVATRDNRPNVLLVGDSITFIAQKNLEAGLVGTYKVAVSGNPKDTAGDRIKDLPFLEGVRPDAVVINLGTNDVLQGILPDVTIPNLEKLGRAFRNARCVVLVTVNADIFSTADPDIRSKAQNLNQRIRDLADREGWGVVPWDQIVSRYLKGGEKQGPLTSDTVHPLPVGRKLLADAYGRALEECRF